MTVKMLVINLTINKWKSIFRLPKSPNNDYDYV